MSAESADALEATAIKGEPVEFAAADGTQLSGRFFAATLAKGSAPVLLCTATGVPQRFYVAFARWLAQQGLDVLTFDYRGIGASLREAHVRLSPRESRIGASSTCRLPPIGSNSAQEPTRSTWSAIVPGANWWD